MKIVRVKPQQATQGLLKVVTQEVARLSDFYTLARGVCSQSGSQKHEEIKPHSSSYSVAETQTQATEKRSKLAAQFNRKLLLIE